MAIYLYRCEGETKHRWEVTKPMSESDSAETCPDCGSSGEKIPAPFSIDKLSLTTGTGVSTESYNPGLGCMTKSTKHAEQIAKSRGLEPVGNEPAENLHKMAEKQQAETREKRWRDADRVMLYD